MAITDRKVLPADALLVPVEQLPAGVRGRLAPEPGGWVLTRPSLRASSRVLDDGSAALLAEFRRPSGIAEAVLRYAGARALDPEATLTAAYPLLSDLLEAGFLVPEEVGEAEEPSHAPGAEVAGFRVVRCLRLLEDTELYQVRREGVTAALKLERFPSGRRPRGGGAFANEAALLRSLKGRVAPRLLARGTLAGRRFLVTEWFPGVDVATAARALRRGEDRRALLDLCRATVAAYVRLHALGVFHGDVHPGNALVGADGEVRLVDFGFGTWERPGAPADTVHQRARMGRGGIAFYYEPELASALQSGGPPPPVSAAGEQYAVAALLDQMLAGAPYRDFSLERPEMLRQIREDPPLPFAERGAPPWPEVEPVLARALAKTPAERFGSLAELESALAAVAVPPALPARRASTGALRSTEFLLNRVLARATSALLPGGAASPRLASVHSGAAGIAYGLYRIALARESPELLAAADRWSNRAAHLALAEAGSFDAPEHDLTPDTVGRISPYHTASGVWCVQALLAHNRGDGAEQARALDQFLAAVEPACPQLDLALGQAGILLAAAQLLDTSTPEGRQRLTALGEEVLAGLWRELDGLPPIPDGIHLQNLGMAHGWAGYAFATLRWCRAAGSPWPAELAVRLAELADRAEIWGRGLRWPWFDFRGGAWRDVGAMPGWCNGSAGLVHLWSLAFDLSGDPRFRALAEGAAWNAWEESAGPGNLCCGLAGRAYALLHLYRHGGGREWLERARQLAELAARDLSWAEEMPDSLYRGEVGLAVLAADLARPEWAAMPFFEDEGWA
jgi:hypothetical protein